MEQPINDKSQAIQEWLSRARFVAATAIVWAGLEFVVGGLNGVRGTDWAPVLTATGFTTPLLTLLVIWVTTLIGCLLRKNSGFGDSFQFVGLALAIWASGTGTIDDWLIARHAQVAPPTAGPYLALIPEYLFFIVLIAGMFLIEAALQTLRDKNPSRPFGPRIRDKLMPTQDAGWLSLGAIVLVAGVILVFLYGPPETATRRGQVYFAVAVASLAGTYAATRFSDARHPVWFVPAPLLTGLIATLVAAGNPGLLIPDEYNALNSIPAWGPVRALPLELTAVGGLATIWMLRAVNPSGPTKTN